MSWRIFLATAVILTGIVLLLNNPGYLPSSAWGYVLPIALMVFGVVLLFAGRRTPPPPAPVQISEPAGTAARAAITLKHGVGQLKLQANQDPNLLFTGTFEGGVEQQLTHQDGTVFLELKTPGKPASRLAYTRAQTLSWNVFLNPKLPTTLHYEGGAADAKMDLSSIQLTALEIFNGASTTDVILPQPHDTLRVLIHSGAETARIRLPQNALVAIRSASGQGELQVDRTRFPEHGAGIFQSEHYADAADRIEITIHGGTGAVQVI